MQLSGLANTFCGRVLVLGKNPCRIVAFGLDLCHPKPTINLSPHKQSHEGLIRKLLTGYLQDNPSPTFY